MQIQALCVDGTVGVPGSALVLGGSSRFLVVCGSVLVPSGSLATSSRFLAICEIKAKINAQIDPQIKKLSLEGVEILFKSLKIDSGSKKLCPRAVRERYGKESGKKACASLRKRCILVPLGGFRVPFWAQLGPDGVLRF